MAGGGGGKEGDWDCSGCRNKNYAFRTFCNRCKQPRIVVDTKTPSDSKWLPRIGDWICTGCTNNNYASREKCKKCGQPKGITAMPAVALAGASVPTHPPYFVRAPGSIQRLLIGGPLQPSRSLSSSWPLVYTGQYGNQATASYGPRPASNWPFGGYSSGISYAGETSSLPPVPNGNEWRTGDWMCTCGFHNYTSRIQCKKCNTLKPNSTPAPLLSPASTALGTKRLASEEFVYNWDNDGQQTVLGFNSYPGVAQLKKMRAANSGGNTVNPVNLQVNPRVPSLPMTPALFGKGAKHWQNGDWICSNCNNHNYASRAQCNRCKSDRDVPSQRGKWFTQVAMLK